MNKWIQNIKKDFDIKESWQPQVSKGLADYAIRTYRLLGCIIIVLQLFMICVFVVKAGGPFSTPRRSGYFLLYLALLIITSVFLALHKTLYTRGKYERMMRLDVFFSAALCLWSCAVTWLDQLGSNGVIVYCYMLPTVAAFSILKPGKSVLLFGGSYILLNATLPFTSYGVYNLFSNVINSTFITLLSITISIMLYQNKIHFICDKIVIEEQYSKIDAMNERLNKMAVTDPLTGTYNRRYMETILRTFIEQTLLSSQPVSGIMIDIDYFKGYNDHYGHPAGDACLSRVAGVIQASLHKTQAYIIRYGGEEFFVCLMNCASEEAYIYAEALRTAVESDNIPRQDRAPGHVTVSLGVSTATLPDAALESLVSRADKALYEAKQSGRNCTKRS